MALDALDVAKQIVRALRRLIARIRGRDADLARQIVRAANSVVLNVAEARGRVGGDGRHLFRVALGSAAEVAAALEVAVEWGHVGEADAAEALALLDRERAMLWRLAGR